MDVGHCVALWVFMGALLMTSLEGHNYGAPRGACVDMVPQHNSRPRDPPAPIDITLSNTTYTPGVPITVTLSANSGKFFKGFLIQARVTDHGPNRGDAVGTFTPIDGTKQTCDFGVALTHSDAREKTRLVLQWNPPSTLKGNIQFSTTIVERQYSYWVALPSDTLAEGQTTTSSSTTTTTTTQATSSSVSTATTSMSVSVESQKPDTVNPSQPATEAGTPTTTPSSSSPSPSAAARRQPGTMTSQVPCVLVGLILLW
ncbi:putative defense protein 3 [Haliotis rubra]|uniref:putative defense protein 3 n=1 Tax=Haliotis rubra TaxID=36100 RepID=UPI001EE59FDE|nr:putative defense protein 3 [Haliotis rubra]